MIKKTISGTLIKSRTPGPRGGTTHTITDRDRTQSVTWTDYASFHVGELEAYQNVTMEIQLDMSAAKPINKGQ